MIELVFLTALVLLASLVITQRIRSRAETIVAASLVFNALLVGPIYALGFANLLTRTILGATTIVLSGGIVAFHWVKGGHGAMRAVGRKLLRVAFAPFSGIALAAKQRSLVTIVGTVTLISFPWLLLTAYYAPAWRDWDSLWYHEAIVGYAIQNHGFAKVDLPIGLQVINGVQRLCEMTQLWFAIWVGRPLVDVANVVFMPLHAGAMFGLAHRYTRDTVSSIACACALILIPGFLRLAQSSMVDPQSGALLLGAAYFVTHHELDRRRASFAIIGLTLAVGAKIWSLVPVGLLTLVLFARLFIHRRALGLRTTAVLAFFTALGTLGMQALTYVRNLVLFQNPFWPMVQYENPKLGIHWKGTIAMSPSNRFSFNDPFPIFIEKMLGKPFTATGAHHHWQIDDYGFAWAWVVLPIGALCGALAVVRWFFGATASRLGFVTTPETQARARSAAALAVVAVVSMAVSPAIHIARYHVPALGMLVACICWFAGKKRPRLPEAAALFACVGSLMMFYWAPPSKPAYSLVFKPSQMVRLMKTRMPNREVDDIGEPPMMLSAVNTETGLAREREIGRGDVVAFDHIDFIGLLFNNSYSNKVVWLSSPDQLAEAERAGAKWIYTRDGSALSSQLRAATDRWELVGPLEREHVGNVWRRRR
jgi:hypothetical protein